MIDRIKGVIIFDKNIPNLNHKKLGNFNNLGDVNDIKINKIPVINKKYGIDFSTGSLGMGLSRGVGLALSLKKKKISILLEIKKI